ncbi:acyl-CoA dehydrogenase family protein [Nocardioides sp. SYSU D00038]|uniref:acyl-CoA dehydrogenase family protein n=1 Tax=Nocardioides sp. SYSU D00038 TaxID=2812554 RepID=UPI0019675729|nr:acyl-CoA dehydrogenase family protein [Nocardioides sp. SYSU D00038]
MASSTTEAPARSVPAEGPGAATTPGRRFATARRLGLADLLQRVAEGEPERERTGRAPYDEVRLLARSGWGALRLPPRLGGRGLSLVELVELTVELAEADSNVAHLLRNHLLFVEGALADEAHHGRWLAEVADGLLWGLGFGETAMPRAGERDFATTLLLDEDGWVLDGTKHYSTGNLYADRIHVLATQADGRVAHAMVPTDRSGVARLDDWDGIGQRFTGSGTTRFRRVRLNADEVVTADQLEQRRPPRATPFAQVYLTAVVAGITAAAAAEAVDLVRGRRRNYFHGLHEVPRHDPLLQATVGRLSADAFAARATVVEAARSLERALAAGGVPEMEAASLDAARAKVVVDELATRTTSGLLDAGSASAVRADLGLDRHWRNARTVIAHNPASYKLRVVGDHELNGTPPPEGSFF